MLTKPARHVWRSVNVTKHGTIRYVRYGFQLVCNSKFVPKMRRFQIFDSKKCRDLEIRVSGQSRSLKVVPLNRLGVVSYWCSIVTLSLKDII